MSRPTAWRSASTSRSNASGNGGPLRHLRPARPWPRLCAVRPGPCPCWPGSARRARRAAGQTARRRCECPGLGHVDHVQGDDDRHAEFQGLRRQVQVAVEVGGIHDGDDDVRPGLPLLAAEDDVDGDHLVGAARRQAVGAGQVDQVERLAGAGHLAFLRLDGDAGIVADVLAQAGEGVEQSGLAGVGIADQGGRRSVEDGGMA